VTRLAPSAAGAAARASGRLAVGLGPRGFLLLGAGLVWLVPAWLDPRALLVLALWNAGVLALAGLDLARLPRAGLLRVTRGWPSALTLGAPADVTVVVENRSERDIDVRAIDYASAALLRDPAVLDLAVPHASIGDARYTVQPRDRGDVAVGPVVVRWRSRLGLAERWGLVPIEQTVRVYPDMQEGRRESMYLIRSRQVATEKRRARHSTAGREFESLRDYRPGDEQRDVCWTATARRARLVTKVYQPERSQAVWLLIDAGRLLRARAGARTLLDHAVTGALTLAQVAMSSGDKVGLLAYGRRVQCRHAAARGAAHLRALVESLATIRAEAVEADHAGAAAEVLRSQKRRALIVWLTEVAETAGVPDVIEQTTSMVPRHVVLFAAMRHPEVPALASSAPGSAAEMYRVMSAQEALDRREVLLQDLRQRGALVIEGSPAELGGGLVDRYLEVKDRGLL
jgi:uncharacterized protein (DUF58 family)